MRRIQDKIQNSVDKYKDLVQHLVPTSNMSETIPGMKRLASKDVYRYRRIRGVNLGSWFTLEPWIDNTPFGSAVPPQGSDLDVAKGANAKANLEKHWDSWIQEVDWKWIVERGINTVRIPIGYYHLCGPEPRVLKGTDFEPYANVYVGAWKRIEGAIKAAGRHGLGVLIDLHAAAGGQNRDPHSGTSTGQVHLWDSDSNLESTLTALKFLVRHLHGIPHCVGLELLNEPANNDRIQAWYESTLAALRREPGTEHFPIYIADAWDLNWYSKFAGERFDFVIVDHHLYRCFTEEESRLSGDEHAAAISSQTRGLLGEMSGKARGNIIVGEWSAGLQPQSLRSDEPGEQDRQRRVFVRAQLECYEATTAGWFFWTYKKGQGWDAGWSMKDAMTAEILPNWFGRKRPPLSPAWDEQQKKGAMSKAVETHVEYWRNQNAEVETWRFEAGYSCGWDDAWMFASFPEGKAVSELGFRSEWIKRRVEEHVSEFGKNEHIWEFEHGFGQAYDAATPTFQ